MKLLIIIFVFLLHCYSKLYQVVSLTRHGARYHVNDFGDGNATEPLWGQLTAVGMRQHEKLGRLFRSQYINNLSFISPNYNSSQVEVFCTPFNRTLQSVQSQMYGVYPAKTGTRLTYVERSLHLPPYSNKTDDQQQNFALPNGHQIIPIKWNSKVMLSDCPNYGKYEKINFQMHADEVKEMNTTYYPFFKKLSQIYNYSLNGSNLFYIMLRVWDVINVDKYLGRPLPKNLTKQDINNVLHLANWFYLMTSLNNNSIMFASGKLQKVISVFDLRVRLPNSYPLKWSFLGGHDTDIFSMYIALNLSSPQCVQQKFRKGSTSALNCQDGGNLFASSLIFQLHSDDEKAFYVKVRSNGKYVKLCNKNSTQCQYSEFKAFTKKSIVTNIEQICGRKIDQQQTEMQIQQSQKMILEQ